uniref:Uncharacterized protein n=1 Tax=Odontella aurita TaxID=265563 RepID=A0A7S4K8C6_9STRA|mmetsp:Transcript_6497/g.19156  ORF Transcript_6497/g.19156 Transcript_6497/m.19156 type:complete len:469 (+) Transcript_6497:131-1537(+)
MSSTPSKAAENSGGIIVEEQVADMSAGSFSGAANKLIPLEENSALDDQHVGRTTLGFQDEGTDAADSFEDFAENGDVEVGRESNEKPVVGIVMEEDIAARPKSLDAAISRDMDKSYTCSFRMPHHSKDTNNQAIAESKSDDHPVRSCFSSSGRGTKNDATAAAEYNFVLDNYVEYADDTNIPRLRGKNEVKILAAIRSSHWVVLCAVVTASCFLTYSLSNHEPFLRADLSQAIVVTLVLATLPEVAASAGAGAFAGMAGMAAIPNYGWLSLLALVVSVIWLSFHRFKILVGCGGRLGTCAFISMNVTVALVGMPSGAISWSLYGDGSKLWSDRLELIPSILTVAACTFLSAVGGAVRLKSKIPLNPVQAPTAIALLCMLILEPTGFSYTGHIDAGLAVGSFVAMASEQYLPSVLDFGAAGFLAGLWILFLDPFFLDFGGKKGFTSFCGFATYVSISKMISTRVERKER